MGVQLIPPGRVVVPTGCSGRVFRCRIFAADLRGISRGHRCARNARGGVQPQNQARHGRGLRRGEGDGVGRERRRGLVGRVGRAAGRGGRHRHLRQWEMPSHVLLGKGPSPRRRQGPGGVRLPVEAPTWGLDRMGVGGLRQQPEVPVPLGLERDGVGGKQTTRRGDHPWVDPQAGRRRGRSIARKAHPAPQARVPRLHLCRP